MYLYFCFLIHSKNYWWASVDATWTAYFFMESKHRKIALMTKQTFEWRSLFIEKRVWFWTACSSRFIECATTLLNRNVSIGSLLVPGKTYSSFFFSSNNNIEYFSYFCNKRWYRALMFKSTHNTIIVSIVRMSSIFWSSRYCIYAVIVIVD